MAAGAAADGIQAFGLCYHRRIKASVGNLPFWPSLSSGGIICYIIFMASSTLTAIVISAQATANISSSAYGLQAVTKSSLLDVLSPAPGIGSGAGNASGFYSNTLTVTSGTPYTLDVTSGSLFVDPLGNPITAGHVIGVKVANLSVTSGQDLTIGGGSNPVLGSVLGFAQAGDVSADPGFFMLYANNPGFAVSGSAKILQVTAAAGTNVPFVLTMFTRSG